MYYNKVNQGISIMIFQALLFLKANSEPFLILSLSWKGDIVLCVCFEQVTWP